MSRESHVAQRVSRAQMEFGQIDSRVDGKGGASLAICEFLSQNFSLSLRPLKQLILRERG